MVPGEPCSASILLHGVLFPGLLTTPRCWGAVIPKDPQTGPPESAALWGAFALSAHRDRDLCCLCPPRRGWATTMQPTPRQASHLPQTGPAGSEFPEDMSGSWGTGYGCCRTQGPHALLRGALSTPCPTAEDQVRAFVRTTWVLDVLQAARPTWAGRLGSLGPHPH